MIETTGENKDYLQLIRSAYQLADVLASTRIMNEVFVLKKDMSYDVWASSVQNLLKSIDSLLAAQCSIQIFKSALHEKLVFKQEQDAPALPTLPAEVRQAAVWMGENFQKAMEQIDQPGLPNTVAPFEQRRLAKDTIAAILELCISVVDIILGDLGLKRVDLAKIYS